MNQEITYSKSSLTIVGGGISGTALSRLLQQHNTEPITLLDKSRRLGGRASLIPISSHDQDLAIGVHQCSIDARELFSQETNQEAMVKELLSDLGWEKVANTEVDHGGQLYKLSLNAWSDLEQKLITHASPISLKLSHHVKQLSYDCNERLWYLYGEYWAKQKKCKFEHKTACLVLSLPPQQSVSLLKEAQQTLAMEQAAYHYIAHLIKQFEQVVNQAQWVVLLRISQDALSDMNQTGLKESKIIKQITKLSINEKTSQAIIALHTQAQWSNIHLEDNTELIEKLCLLELDRLLISKDSIVVLKVHRWRYASATLKSKLDPQYLTELQLGFCGEAQVEGSIERGVQRALKSALKLFSEVDLSTQS